MPEREGRTGSCGHNAVRRGCLPARIAETVDNGTTFGHRETGVPGSSATLLALDRQPDKGSDMGLYGGQVLPRIMNVACAAGPAVAELRQRVCAGLSGEVVEIGFGSGLNVPHYPGAVSKVDAVEPSDVSWKLAADRVARSAVPVERSGLDGQSLTFEADTFDSALSTWTMCSIPDIGAALAELRRVLRPGGTLHFIDHGLAPDDSVVAWQRRLDPWQQRLFGGCHLTRPIRDLVEQAGFVIVDVDVFYEQGAPKTLGAASLGVATSRG